MAESRANRFVFSFLSAFALMSAVACGPPPPVHHSVNPCASARSVDHGGHAFAAALLALQHRGWNFENIDAQTRVVLATACLRGSQHCATLKFTATPQGVIGVSESPAHPFNPELREHVPRWMTFFSSAYSQFSCQTDEALREQVNKYGVSF